MTTVEFSNEFDLLWDNLRYNNSGYSSLNEYEKSVFLTQAQEEIIKNYFNPKGNDYQEGFGDSDKRDMDFSNLIKTSTGVPINIYDIEYSGVLQSLEVLVEGNSYTPKKMLIKPAGSGGTVVFSGMAKEDITAIFNGNQGDPALLVALINNTEDRYVNAILADSNGNADVQGAYVLTTPFYLSLLPAMDDRSIKFEILDEVFFIINENLKYDYLGLNINSVVKPLSSTEYDRLASKVYFEPPKKISWRLMSGTTVTNTSIEILTHTGATGQSYVVRYVKRPAPIVLEDIGTYSINGVSAISNCELNPIIHREILTRSVVLATNALTGDLNSNIKLEQRAE